MEYRKLFVVASLDSYVTIKMTGALPSMHWSSTLLCGAASAKRRARMQEDALAWKHSRRGRSQRTNDVWLAQLRGVSESTMPTVLHVVPYTAPRASGPPVVVRQLG